MVWVTYDASPECLNDLFPEGGTDGKPFTKMDESNYAEVHTCRRKKPDVKGGVLIRFASKSAMTADVITHESTHAALEIFKYCDIRVDYLNQEPFAYLAGFIADCIDQVRKNKFKD